MGNSPYTTVPFHTSVQSVSTGLGGLSLALVVLAIVLSLSSIGVLVILIVANRADPDPTGRRPQSVYFFGVSFVTLLVAIVASTAMVADILQRIGSQAIATNAFARTLLISALITLVSVTLLVTHLRRGVALATAAPQPADPSLRVGQSYVGAVSFVAVLTLLGVAVLVIYLVFALLGPGVFGSFGGRTQAFRLLIDAVYLGVILVVVLRTHADLVPPGLHIVGGRSGRGGGPGHAAPPPAPPAPPGAPPMPAPPGARRPPPPTAPGVSGQAPLPTPPWSPQGPPTAPPPTGPFPPPTTPGGPVT